MMQLYIVLLFIGVIMTFFQLIYLTAGRRGINRSIKVLEDKKEELEKLLNDAEMMVEELNKLSDFIVQQADSKNSEMSKTLCSFDEKLGYFKAIESELRRLTDSLKKNKVKDINTIHTQNPIAAEVKHIENIIPKQRTIQFSAKHMQAMNMAKMGLNDTEIAKNLNIGKGEIELIRGLTKSETTVVN